MNQTEIKPKSKNQVSSMLSSKFNNCLVTANKLHLRNITKSRVVVNLSANRSFSKTAGLENTNQERLLKFYKANYYKYYNRGYYKYYALGTIFAIGFVSYKTSETVNTTMKYTYKSIKRVYNVTSTLMKCIYYYSVTITKKNNMSVDEYTNLLNKTHKKAADITLVTIQENGGIYIKLRPTHICNDLFVTSSMDRHYDSITTRML